MEFFATRLPRTENPSYDPEKGQIEGMEQNVGVYKDQDKYLARAVTV